MLTSTSLTLPPSHVQLLMETTKHTCRSEGETQLLTRCKHRAWFRECCQKNLQRCLQLSLTGRCLLCVWGTCGLLPLISLLWLSVGIEMWQRLCHCWPSPSVMAAESSPLELRNVRSTFDGSSRRAATGGKDLSEGTAGAGC